MTRYHLSLLIACLVWMTITVYAHPPGTFATPSEGFGAQPMSSISPKMLFPGINYAMVCMQEKSFTDYCQNWGGYYCNSSGKLKTTLPNNEEKDFCEGHSECVNLFPKPNNCILGLAGSLYCSRDVVDDASVGGISPEALEMDHNTGLVSRSDEEQLGFQHGDSLKARGSWNNYALVCAGQKELTWHCQKEDGMYCSAVGALKSTKNNPDDLCYEYCECINLFPKPNRCFLGISGVAYCARSVDEAKDSDAASLQTRSEQLDLFVASEGNTPNCLRTRDGQTTCISSDFSWTKIEGSAEDTDCSSGSAELMARSETSATETASESATLTESLSQGQENEAHKSPFKKGEYVMICGLDDRDHTLRCQRSGYYCDSEATLKRNKLTPNPACEGMCECKDLNPKPLCYMWSGAVFCVRSLEGSEQLLDAANLHTPQTSSLAFRDVEVPKMWGGVNNYAMNCFDSSYATKACLTNGYYCGSTGKIVHKKDGKEDKACDKEWCQCINLNPVPRCYLAAAGVLRCKRFDGRTVDLANTYIPESESIEDYLSVHLRSSLALEEDGINTEAAETSVSNPRSLQDLTKRHNYAMVCWDNSQMTAICNQAGYFCNKKGRLEHKRDSKDDPDCSETGVCDCVNLFPQPRCFWSSSGFMCARDDASEISTIASPAPPSLELRDTGHLVRRHDYAMNCWDSSVMTALCAARGYYCNSNGKFVLEKGKKGDKDCTDDVPCVCVDLFPKPKCFLQESGVLRCATRRDTDIKQLAAPVYSQKNVETVERENGEEIFSAEALEQTLVSLKRKRSEDILLKRHDFAMSCLDNRAYTKICADVGCYCNRDGRLIYKGKGKGLDGCWKDQECQCMSLVAKPKCYLAITGSIACVSSREDEAAGEVFHFDFASVMTARPKSDAGRVKASDSPDVVTLNIEHTKSPNLAPRQFGNTHDYAMVCLDDQRHTHHCANHGYYCDSKGRMQHQSGSDDWTCEEEKCRCMNLNVKPKCFLSSKNSISCVSNPHNKRTTTELSQVERTSQSPSLTTRQLGSNDYAMNCLDHKDSTGHCQKKGYYCNSIGKFLHTGGTQDWVCEDGTCKCVSLVPKPKCFLQKQNSISCVSNPHSKRAEGLLADGSWSSEAEDVDLKAVLENDGIEAIPEDQLMEIEIQEDDEAYHALLRQRDGLGK